MRIKQFDGSIFSELHVKGWQESDYVWSIQGTPMEKEEVLEWINEYADGEFFSYVYLGTTFIGFTNAGMNTLFKLTFVGE